MLESGKRVIRRSLFTLKNLNKVFKIVNGPNPYKSRFPDAQRKSKATIFWENLTWVAKFGEVNKFYYLHGLDRKNGSDREEILSVKEFSRIRDRRNLHMNENSYNYVCILRDKFLFSQLLKSLGFLTTKNLALIDANEVKWLNDMKTLPLTSLSADRTIAINGFCKKLTGILGAGAFTLKIEDGRLYIKEKEISLDELKKKLTGMYLLQERIIQHPKMSELHQGSVNTIRINTFNNNGKVEVFSAALRIGTKGSSVDNWAAGGIVAGIDLETGRLRTEGFFKPGYGGRVEQHPDTGIIFKEFEIPFFSESLRQTCSLHSYLYGIHSVGWDIAITENGPMFIEGNDDWDGAIPMTLEKNFKSRLLKNYV